MSVGRGGDEGSSPSFALGTSNLPWLAEDDVRRLRMGDYADPPYINLRELLSGAHRAPNIESSLRRAGRPGLVPDADTIVDTRWIPRRHPFTVVAGLPRALEILRLCAGVVDGGIYRSTASDLQVWAVEDGTIVEGGSPMITAPALVVLGRYYDFAHLKTPVLGTLARASRVATNTYRMLTAARGKPVFTFSARYDPHEAQALDGYAYDIGVRTFNNEHSSSLQREVSTVANGDYTGCRTIGTLSHEATACFLGDTSALMRAFCENMPLERLRVALVDFHNDCVGEAREVLRAVYAARRDALESGRPEMAERYRLDGVRLDTSKELVDRAEAALPDSQPGVTPRLVRLVRDAIDQCWQEWDLPADQRADAQLWCQQVRIIVSGGFDEHRIEQFEAAEAPVDGYGVGSALLAACPGSFGVTDFSAGVVAVMRRGERIDVSKRGRGPTWTDELRRTTLRED